MIEAFFGLIGIFIGFVLSLFKDWFLQSRKTKKEYEYLSIRVACVLDLFVYECVEVARDDGTFFGQYDEDGCAQAQVTLPTFNPYSLDVEWKSLPSELLYETLNLPNMIERANEIITSRYDYAAVPPYYEEYFEERQLQYSQLGISASALATKLREYGKLPNLEFPAHYNPNKILNDKKDEIQSLMLAREKSHAESMKSLSAESAESRQ